MRLYIHEVDGRDCLRKAMVSRTTPQVHYNRHGMACEMVVFLIFIFFHMEIFLIFAQK